MTYPWYRSRSFWFGLVGLVMLLTGWLALPRSGLQLNYTKVSPGGWPYVTYSVSRNVGNLSFCRMESVTSNSPRVEETGWRASTYRVGEVEGKDFFGEIWFAYDDGSGFAVANWFIVTTYIFLWLGGLVLWQRRKHRLMNASIP